jgi:hypothetical protein
MTLSLLVGLTEVLFASRRAITVLPVTATVTHIKHVIDGTREVDVLVEPHFGIELALGEEEGLAVLSKGRLHTLIELLIHHKIDFLLQIMLKHYIYLCLSKVYDLQQCEYSESMKSSEYFSGVAGAVIPAAAVFVERAR